MKILFSLLFLVGCTTLIDTRTEQQRQIDTKNESDQDSQVLVDDILCEEDEFLGVKKLVSPDKNFIEFGISNAPYLRLASVSNTPDLVFIQAMMTKRNWCFFDSGIEKKLKKLPLVESFQTSVISHDLVLEKGVFQITRQQLESIKEDGLLIKVYGQKCNHEVDLSPAEIKAFLLKLSKKDCF